MYSVGEGREELWQDIFQSPMGLSAPAEVVGGGVSGGLVVVFRTETEAGAGD